MLKIENNKISLTRGDTAYLDVAVVNQYGQSYPQHEGDQIVFSMKRDMNDEVYALQKKVAAGEAIVLTPADTAKLPCGKYYYDVQLNTSLGEVFTIIGKSVFCLGEEVSR